MSTKSRQSTKWNHCLVDLDTSFRRMALCSNDEKLSMWKNFTKSPTLSYDLCAKANGKACLFLVSVIIRLVLVAGHGLGIGQCELNRNSTFRCHFICKKVQKRVH